MSPAGLAHLGVEQGARDVPAFGVAERPRACRARRLPRRPGALGLPLAATGRQRADDVAQRGLPELAQRLRREHQRAVGGALEDALLLQLALQLGQALGVDAGLLAEGRLEGLEVDVLHPRARVGLRELLGQGVHLPQLLHGPGGLAHAHRVVAAEAAAALPVLAGAHALELLVEPGELLGQPRVAEGLLHEALELGALLGRQRVHHPLGRGGPLGEQVDQLVGGLRVLREELAVLGHELAELLRGVLAAGVRLEQVVQVRDHLADPLDVLGRRVLHRLLHALEALVERLPAQEVLDLLVGLARLGVAPVVVLQLGHGPRGRRGQRVELHLAEPGVVGVLGLQGVPLGLERPLEQLADLLQRPVEPVLALQLAAPLVEPAHEVVETLLVAQPAAHQLAHRLPRRRALHDVAAQLVHRRPQVERRRQGVRPVVEAAVGVAPAARAALVAAARVRVSRHRPPFRPRRRRPSPACG